MDRDLLVIELNFSCRRYKAGLDLSFAGLHVLQDYCAFIKIAGIDGAPAGCRALDEVAVTQSGLRS